VDNVGTMDTILCERASHPSDTGRITIIACATVIEEMLPYLSPGMSHQVLDFGLHIRPDNLRGALQEAIDIASETAETIILGYGLCSQAVVGLTANGCTLVVPRVDDCIAIFLGSDGAYREQQRAEPGTYYLTKGWIEVSDTLLDEYDRTIERYGQQRADRMMQFMLKHYSRLAFIDTGHQDQERYREYSRTAAARLGLRYEEIPGSNALVLKTLNGPWDHDFVVVCPGETISYLDFKKHDRPHRI
jgi:hypothetical protein